MTISIFGATGMTGKRLVAQALFRNHKVIAFGRNVFTSTLKESNQLHLFKGALFDEEQVYEAIKGSDAVLSAIGGSVDGTDKARSRGMKNIISQMNKAGVTRIIAMGGMGILDDGKGGFKLHSPGYPADFLPVGEEHLSAYNSLAASNLSWTFVCCPDLVDEDPTGIYYTAANVMPPGVRNQIYTGDLAMFMLEELEKNQYLKTRVGISN